MWENDASSLFLGFQGKVRLFPLPNLVMFPHVMQPLHVFEHRYREMLADAIAGDRRIAMALLAPGWKPDYEGRPAIESVVCLGRVVSRTELPDGTSNLLLQGLRRARVTRELPPLRLFREAEVELLGDEYPVRGDARRPEARRELLNAFGQFAAAATGSAALREQLEALDNPQIPLGVITDVIAFCLRAETRVKQQLLSDVNVDSRAATLTDMLRADPGPRSPFLRRPGGKFPPDFSNN